MVRKETNWTGQVVTALVLALVGWIGATAQTVYGTLNGTITDPSGAVISGAQVVIKNLDTGLTRETTTNAAGYFRETGLVPGRYSVSVTASGFATIVREPLTVEAGDTETVDIDLKPGGAQEVVTVLGESSLIETTKSQISKSVDSRRILELPGRNTLNGLALLQPGVVNNQNGRPGSGFSVNGARTRSNNFTIDGANNNDPSLSIPVQGLPPEALGEFQVITNNFSAEYGRNAGAVVNQFTRSGTNEFHGIAHYTWQGNSFDALTTGQQRTFNAAKARGLSDKLALRSSRPVIVDQNFGGTLGGPIKKDHTFFFVSYDRNNVRQTAVPTPAIAISPEGAAALRANASRFAPGALDFLLTTFPLANDPTPRGTINVVLPAAGGQPALTIPVPVTQFNPSLNGAFGYGTDFWRLLGRVDTRLGANDQFTFRFLMDRFDDPGAPIALPPSRTAGQITRNYNGVMNYVRTFGGGAVNEFRFSHIDRALNFPENFPPQITVTGFNTIGNQNFPQFRNSKLTEFTDNFSKIIGNHSMKFGGTVQRVGLNSFFAPNLRGTVSYPSMTDLLLDRNANFSQFAGDGTVDAVTWESGFFFQDDYRFRPNLTINLGLRYEYTTTPFGFFSNASPDINNFAPRIGFAYSPRLENDFLKMVTGGSKTVIRGGYGISYDQIFQNILLNNSRNFPRGVNVAIGPITGQRLYVQGNRPAPPRPEDFVAQGGNPNLLPIRLFSPNKRVAQPYSQAFNLGIERAIGNDYVVKIFYIGSRGSKLVRETEQNLGFQEAVIQANPAFFADILPRLQPIRNAAGQITSRRVDPTRGSILVGDGLASSSYHSMQLTFAKRFSHGIQFEANYTWSAFINDSDDILGGQTNNTLPSNPLNLRQDRARSGLDQPHRFVANYLFELPRINVANGILDRVVNGWSLSGVTTLASGTPYTILNSENALGILPGQIATVTDSQRPNVNVNGVPGTATGTNANPFFVLNRTNSGINGNLGRNSERTGGIANTNLAFIKRVRTFGERQSIDLRWEVFNVFNRRNFTVIPASTVSLGTNAATFLNFGQTNVGGRSMLVTLRYIF